MKPYTFTLAERKTKEYLQTGNYLSPYQILEETKSQHCPLWHDDELFLSGILSALQEYELSKKANTRILQ